MSTSLILCYYFDTFKLNSEPAGRGRPGQQSSLGVRAGGAQQAGGASASQGGGPRSQQIRAAWCIHGVSAIGGIGGCRHHARNPLRPLMLLSESAIAGWLRASAPSGAPAPWP